MQTNNLATPITKLVVSADDALTLDNQSGEYLGSLLRENASRSDDVYTSSDLDSYLLIDSFESAEHFIKSHPLLFGSALLVVDFDPDIAIESVWDSSRTLNLTRWLYAQSSQSSMIDFYAIEHELESLGFSYDFDSTGQSSMSFGACKDYENNKDLGFEIGFDSLISPYTELLCSFIAAESYPAAPNSFRYAQNNDWQYRYWDFPEIWWEKDADIEIRESALAHAKESEFEPLDFLGEVSIVGSIPRNSDMNTYSAFADALMTLHLGGIKTICVNGVEQRTSNNGISALWWFALDWMRGRRIYQCEACRKVGVAGNERGHKRRFCSDACKEWRKKHRTTDEQGNYLEWLPPRR